MHIAVIGTGYVGLVSGACFAEFGTDVICVDVDTSKIEKLNNGIIPIYEPGLDAIVKKNVEAGRLHFTTDIKSAVERAQVVFLAVGTPPQADGTPDMSYYRQAAKDVAESMNDYKVLVTKSTVPVGTGKWLRDFIQENIKIETEFGVASNPEFLREGAAITDFMRPDRVVIGSNEDRAIEVMKELYRPLFLIETPIVITSLEAAELIKYAANAFLATKITFINEVANLCDAIGCDVHDVARGMGMDNRIGRKFLHPGPGYGGSCFPKDTRALTTVADQYGVETLIVDAVIEANERQRDAMIPKIEKLVGNLSGKKIGILGLSFKPETDDMRESPAIEIISELIKRGASIKAFDPVAMEESTHFITGIEYANDEYDAIAGADAMVIVTEWNQFRALDLERVKSLLVEPKIADLRNIYEPKEMREMGFEYVGVGR
ncbi:MAG TPA: UDP-glucose/GDP-mannose dehydrogenase family protein [Pyrinomonadaceae bacterium]|nr:UDP-glucose/GDP-mannose dehydrogenase family protein [Chloracidobacterium sp.]MBP9934438.1 UDP-glucose/GDP-mannose dehydrogenase family protein [Pyrinomonadaceae bacterium]MBK7802582.1 UDP-glucose/GDP-mannose dehydrogenase family protein [Chloracidobacterium sp.]MBK9437434.1 UDP-glucose/GDP-mannose dehydrogenase family protein [Chloracidobacterium sp.]MBK9766163.1 UDP-glucose/GDP-mannose dehydrogenase family protein [Chloracidobacterium sp.]